MNKNFKNPQFLLKIKNSIPVSLIITISSIYFLWLCTRELQHNHDEGCAVTAAKLLLEGGVLFKDILQLRIAEYWLAFIYLIFGPTVIAGRIWTAFIAILITLMLFQVSKKLNSKIAAFSVPFAFMGWSLNYWHVCSFEWDSVFLFLLVMIILASNWGQTIKGLFIAGVLISINITFNPKLALLSALASGTYLVLSEIIFNKQSTLSKSIISGIKKSFFIALGVTIPITLILLFFIWHGEFSTVTKYTFLGPLTSFNYLDYLYIPYPLPFNNVWNDTIGSQTINFGNYKYIYWLAPLALIIGFIILILKLIRKNDYKTKSISNGLNSNLKSQKENSVKFYCLVLIQSIFMFSYSFHRSDIFHFVFSLPLVLVIIVFVSEFILKNIFYLFTKKNTVAPCVIAAILGIIIAGTGIHGTSYSLLLKLVPVDLKAAQGIYVIPERSRELKELKSFILNNTKPGDYALSVPDFPWLYFWFPLKPVSRHINMDFGDFDDETISEVIAGAEKYNHEWVFILDFSRTLDNKGFREYSPRLYNYIMNNYEFYKRIGSYTILKRKFYNSLNVGTKPSIKF